MLRIYQKAAFLAAAIFLLGVWAVQAAPVDLPNAQDPQNPNAFVRVYETDDPDYYQYRNGRYAFNVLVPVSFAIAKEGANRDGASFGAVDAPEMLMAWGAHNIFKVSPSQALQNEVREIGPNYITYQASGDDWYVLSWVQNGRAHYKKVFVSPEYLNVFLLWYPKERGGYYKDVVVKIERSFVPGWKTGRAILGYGVARELFP